jgi:hypothetical protein
MIGLAAGNAAATTATSLVLSPDQPTAAAIAEDPSLQNRTVFDLVMTSTADWTNSSLKFSLTDGSFYNAADGGNVPTSTGSWGSAGFMHLRYDTFVARPPDFLVAPIVAGRHPDDGPGPAIFSTSVTSAAWLDATSAYPPGTYTIARLTVSNDAVGSFYGSSFDSALPGTPQPFNNAINKQLRWDTDPVSVGAQGGTGTWNASAANFWDGTGNIAWDNVRNDVAVFEDTAGTVNVAAVSASALRFEEPGYVLTGGLITMVGFARMTANEDATINSAIVSSVGLIKDGDATLTLGGAISGITGNYQVNAGHLNVNDLDGSGGVTVSSGAGLTANRVRRTALVLAGPGATADIRPNGTPAGTSVVNSLTINGGSVPTAKLDIANNALVVDYSATSPLATIRDQIRTAFNSGAWNGQGISSSMATATGLAVGYAEASAIFSSFPATFTGQSVDNTSVLVRFTRFGDADLNGVVNLLDFNRLAASFGSSGATWSGGDFNYDSTVNLLDFNLLAGNFGLSASPDGPTPQDWAALAAAVPEPVALPLVMICTAAIFISRPPKVFGAFDYRTTRRRCLRP